MISHIFLLLKLRKLFVINRGRTSVAICYGEWHQILADCATEVTKKKASTTLNKAQFSHKSNKNFTYFSKEGFKEH